MTDNNLCWCAPPEEIRALICVERGDGTTLQTPFDAFPDALASWLTVVLAPRVK